MTCKLNLFPKILKRRKRELFLKSLIENRTIFLFQILINREEKENFFFKILKIEKRKRMKIQFFRARGSERGQYFSRFLEIRDSCWCLLTDCVSDSLTSLLEGIVTLKIEDGKVKLSWKAFVYFCPIPLVIENCLYYATKIIIVNCTMPV